MTITTSAMVSINSNCTSLTEARMVSVRSVRTGHVNRRRAGRPVSCGNSFLIWSTTLMMLRRAAAECSRSPPGRCSSRRPASIFDPVDNGCHIPQANWEPLL